MNTVLWNFQNYLDKVTSQYELLILKLILNEDYDENAGISK